MGQSTSLSKCSQLASARTDKCKCCVEVTAAPVTSDSRVDSRVESPRADKSPPEAAGPVSGVEKVDSWGDQAEPLDAQVDAWGVQADRGGGQVQPPVGNDKPPPEADVLESDQARLRTPQPSYQGPTNISTEKPSPDAQGLAPSQSQPTSQFQPMPSAAASKAHANNDDRVDLNRASGSAFVSLLQDCKKGPPEALFAAPKEKKLDDCHPSRIRERLAAMKTTLPVSSKTRLIWKTKRIIFGIRHYSLEYVKLLAETGDPDAAAAKVWPVVDSLQFCKSNLDNRFWEASFVNASGPIPTVDLHLDSESFSIEVVLRVTDILMTHRIAQTILATPGWKTLWIYLEPGDPSNDPLRWDLVFWYFGNLTRLQVPPRKNGVEYLQLFVGYFDGRTELAAHWCGGALSMVEASHAKETLRATCTLGCQLLEGVPSRLLHFRFIYLRTLWNYTPIEALPPIDDLITEDGRCPRHFAYCLSESAPRSIYNMMFPCVVNGSDYIVAMRPGECTYSACANPSRIDRYDVSTDWPGVQVLPLKAANVVLSLSLQKAADRSETAALANLHSVVAVNLIGETVSTLDVELARDELWELRTWIQYSTGIHPGNLQLLFGLRRCFEFTDDSKLFVCFGVPNPSDSAGSDAAVAAAGRDAFGN